MRRGTPAPTGPVRRSASVWQGAAWAAALLLVSAVAAAGAADDEKPAEANPPDAGAGGEKTDPSVVYPKTREVLEPEVRKDPLAFLQRARDWAEARIGDYTCHFQKLERIDGELQKPEQMRMKFRADPFSVYLKWTGGPSEGQEALYVDGKYKDKVQVHPSGILGVIFRKVALDPTGKTARKHSRRPLTMAGMVNMVRLVTKQCEEAHKRGDLTLTYEGIRNEGGRPAYVLKRLLPKGKGYPCETLVIFIDTETLACTRSDAYDWNGELISHYFYTHIDYAPNLTDRDFDTSNSNYGYRLF
jgi:hypothetical protein